MGTNKDQAQAHKFMLQRVTSALTVQETDPEQPPFRRPIVSAIVGIVIGALISVGFWVFGLLVPGGDTFAEQDVIAVEKETGARYVLINGRLHPVLNYTSALLALDQHVEVEMVSRTKLTGIPVGPPIGIPDAPDSLPDSEQLLTGSWSMCDKSTVDDQGRALDRSVLLVGQSPVAGRDVSGRALLVHSDNRAYLVHEGYRHEIAAKVDVALDLSKETPVAVDGTWLDTVPAGKPLGPIPLADAGARSTAVPGMELRVGQLIEVDDGAPGDEETTLDKPHYLVTGDRLQSISPLQATIQRAVGAHAGPPEVVTSRELLDARFAAPQRSAADDPPWTRPELVGVDNLDVTVCATFQPDTTVPTLTVDARLPDPASSATDGAGQVGVSVPAGTAALIEIMSSPDAEPSRGTVALVTDQGRLHPLAEPGHLVQVLGFDGVQPVRITAPLADRLPRGQSLSTEAARTPVSGG